MSGEKARAINRAWEKWPDVDAEKVAELVSAGWDACAAQPEPQPNREALLWSLRVAMLGTTDGDFIAPDSDIPAGEMFRLAGEWVETKLAALSPTAEGEVEYRAKIGHIVGDSRTHPDGAKEAALDALSDYPFEFPERYDEPVVESRTVTPWVAVTP